MKRYALAFVAEVGTLVWFVTADLGLVFLTMGALIYVGKELPNLLTADGRAATIK